jgi:hypothetical protein
VASTATAPSSRPSLGRAVLRAVAVIGVIAVAMAWPGLNLADTHSYWAPPLDDLYGVTEVGGADFYPYSPVLAQVLEPIRQMPWPVFAGFWLLVMAVCLVALVGPWALLVVFIPPVLIELHAGNIHLPLALAIGLGLRYPATWAYVLVSKPSLGIGLLWFVVRREWRELGVALLATAVVTLISAVLLPQAWADWIAVIIANAGTGVAPDYPGVIHIPLLVRLPLAAAIVIWGARTDRRWTIALAAPFALPVMWINGLALWLAIPMLEGWRSPHDALASVRRSLRGRGDPGAARHGDELAIREEPDASRQQEGRGVQHGDHQQQRLEPGE